MASLARPSATPPYLQHQRYSARAIEDAGLQDTGDAGDDDARGTERPTGGTRAAASGPSAADDRRPSVPPPPPSAGSRSPPEMRRKGHVQFSERLVKRRGTQIMYVPTYELSSSRPHPLYFQSPLRLTVSEGPT